MPQIPGAGIGGTIAEREIAHPPEARPSRPTEVRPGREGFCDSSGESARRSTPVHVAVGIARHAGQRLAARSSHEHVRAGRLRSRSDFPLLPDVTERFQLLAKAPAPAAAIDARRLIILPASADRQAEGEPAVRESVQGGRLLRQDDRIAQRPDHDHGGEPHPPGHRSRGGQRREGLVIVVGDAVDDPKAAEWTGVRTLRPFQHELSADSGRRGRQADPDVHVSVAPSEEMISFPG